MKDANMEFYRFYKAIGCFFIALSSAIITIAQYKTVDAKTLQQILLAGSVSAFLAHFFVRKNIKVLRSSPVFITIVSTVIDMVVIAVALNSSALILLIAGATIIPIQNAIFIDFWECAKRNIGNGPDLESAMRTFKTAGSSAGLVAAAMLSLYGITVSYELAVLLVLGFTASLNAGDAYMAATTNPESINTEKENHGRD